MSAASSDLSVIDLAEAAVSCPAFTEALRLARWIGPGRELTTREVLRPVDAMQACRDLGIAMRGPRLRSMLDVPELMDAWETAAAAGFLEIERRHVWAVPELPEAGSVTPGEAEPILGAWLQAATFLLNVDEEPCPGCLLVLNELYTAGEPRSLEQLAAAIAAVPGPVELDGGPCPDCGLVHETASQAAWHGFHGPPDGIEHAADELAGLLQFGAAEVGDVTVRLTALGELLGQAVLEWGAPPPEADAAMLVSAVSTLPPPVAATVAGPWLGARSAADAGSELLSFAETARGGARAAALALASDLGPDGWREWAERPGVGAYARQWLASAGETVTEDPADGAWLAADSGRIVRDVLAEALPPSPAGAALAEPGGEAAVPATGQVAKLKITLRGVSKPPVWRRVLVRADITLRELHDVIQLAMGWQDYHLHVFSSGGREYGVPDPELGYVDERWVRLSQLLADPGDRLSYAYDLGDYWEHEVVLEQVRPEVPDEVYPACVAGNGACPPEDSGGPWGYAKLKRVLADPEHEDHQSLLEWLAQVRGWDFEPGEFSVAEVNARLGQLTPER